MKKKRSYISHHDFFDKCPWYHKVVDYTVCMDCPWFYKMARYGGCICLYDYDIEDFIFKDMIWDDVNDYYYNVSLREL